MVDNSHLYLARPSLCSSWLGVGLRKDEFGTAGPWPCCQRKSIGYSFVRLSILKFDGWQFDWKYILTYSRLQDFPRPAVVRKQIVMMTQRHLVVIYWITRLPDLLAAQYVLRRWYIDRLLSFFQCGSVASTALVQYRCLSIYLQALYVLYYVEHKHRRLVCWKSNVVHRHINPSCSMEFDCI